MILARLWPRHRRNKPAGYCLRKTGLSRRGASWKCLRDEAPIARRIHTGPSGDENPPCSVSGGCEASRNSPPFILPSTTTSICDAPSAHGTISSSTAPPRSPSGVRSGRPHSLSSVENADLRISSDSALKSLLWGRHRAGRIRYRPTDRAFSHLLGYLIVQIVAGAD